MGGGPLGVGGPGRDEWCAIKGCTVWVAAAALAEVSWSARDRSVTPGFMFVFFIRDSGDVWSRIVTRQVSIRAYETCKKLFEMINSIIAIQNADGSVWSSHMSVFLAVRKAKWLTNSSKAPNLAAACISGWPIWVFQWLMLMQIFREQTEPTTRCCFCWPVEIIIIHKWETKTETKKFIISVFSSKRTLRSTYCFKWNVYKSSKQRGKSNFIEENKVAVHLTTALSVSLNKRTFENTCRYETHLCYFFKISLMSTYRLSQNIKINWPN